MSLLGASDGSLWIGTASGLAQWKNGDLINFPETLGRINSIFEDSEGTIWVGRSRNPEGGLCRIAGAKAVCYGPKDGCPPFAIPVIGDREGNIWVGGATELVRWKSPGSSIKYSPPILKSSAGLNGMAALAVRPDGSMWVGMTLPGRGGGLQQLAQGSWKAFVTPAFDSSALSVNALLLDSRNALWVGTEGAGVYRIYEGRVDRFRSADGLSSDSAQSFFEDREGNLWVVTSEGLDRFRDFRVVNFSTHEGLSGDQASSVLASWDGTVWIGNGSGLDFVHGVNVSSIGPKNGLPGPRVTSLFEDHAGRLWVGVENGLFINEGGKFTPVRRRDGSATSVVVAMTEDVDGNIWAQTISPRRLLRIQDREVREEYTESQIPYSNALASDPRGGVWLGFRNGDLGRYRMGNLETFSLGQSPSARVTDLIVNSDGSVLGAISEGLIEWRSGNLRRLNASNGLPCNRIYTIIFDRRSDLWLYAECGLIKIAGAQLQKWREQPDAKISFKIFDVFDGVQPTLPSFRPAAALSTDGRLWFANERVVQMIDPEHLAENPIPPPVFVENVIADRKIYSPEGELRLPPLTRDLEIHYTALSFAVPQKARFRYKLEGHDLDWQDPGTRRQAFYNDLPPGNYTFRVMASNNDGVWNETGATLAFRVEPAWYQTHWFLILCVGAGLFLVWGVYSLRVRQIARALSVRFDERLAERTRIARDFHDTLLQSFQGVLMKFHAVTYLLPDRPDEAKQNLESVIEQARQAVTEGRDAVQGLRSSAVVTNELAPALRALGEALAADQTGASSPDFRVIVEGASRDLVPLVRDEVYRIAGEALRNAFRHAQAERIEVEILYAKRELRLCLRDNGKGIDPKVLADGGREGHYGLAGIRERAKLVGGKLVIWSSPDSGTEAELTIPASLAYAKSPSRRRSLFSRKRK